MINNTVLEKEINTVLKFLQTDLKDCDNLTEACFPILLTVSSGIDFLGALCYGFNTFSSKRYPRYINEYMGQIQTTYSNEGFAKYLYNFLRCKISHEACINGDFVTKNSDDFIPFHLKYFEEQENYQIYIHPIEFKNDFIGSLNIFLRKFNENSGFKNDVLSRYNDRTNEVFNEVEEFRITYPFGLQRTNLTSWDGTNAPPKIRLGGSEEEE